MDEINNGLDPVMDSGGLIREETEEQEPQSRKQIGLVEDLAIGARDLIDNVFQGDQRTKEEIGEDRQLERDIAQRASDKAGEQTSFASESVRAVVGGVATAGENIGEAAEFVGDTAKSLISKTGLIDVDEKDIPWSSEYEAAHWDLGTAKNQTVVGNFAREGLGILINIRQLAGLGIGAVGGGQSIASRLASETVRGGLVDFLIDPDSGNLSNLVQDSKYANLFSQALAHKEEDNQYIRRLKNTMEGGVMGLAIDGVSELYGALRAGKAAVKAGKTTDEAVETVVDKVKEFEEVKVVENEIDFLDEDALQKRAEEQYLRLKEEYNIPTRDDGVTTDWANIPDGRVLRFEDAQAKLPIDTQMRFNGEAKKSQVLPNGNRVSWHFSTDTYSTQEFKNVFGVTPIEVSWGIMDDDKGIGTSGRQLIKYFQDLAKKELPVGTVLMNSPVDSFDSTAAKRGALTQEAVKPYVDAYLDHHTEVRWQQYKDDGIRRRRDNVRKELVKELDDLQNAGGARVPLDRIHGYMKRRIDEAGKANDELPFVEYINENDGSLNWDPDALLAENSIRAKLYERAGFGPVQGGVTQFAIVRGTPDAKGRWIEPINQNPFEPWSVGNEIKNQIVEAKAAAKEEISINRVENRANSAREGVSEGMYEPHERAAETHGADIEDVAVTQQQEGAAFRLFNDYAYQTINSTDDLNAYIKERADWIDIDDIERRLGDQGVHYRSSVMRSIAGFATDGAYMNLEDLRFTNTQGIKGVDAGGAVALDVMVKDAASQMVDLADNLMEIADIGADFRTQGKKILLRAEALMKLKKEATIFSSYNLQNWKDMPLELVEATKKADAEINQAFAKYKIAFRSSDPADWLRIKDEFKQFAYGLSITKGDPTKIGNFWFAWYKSGFQNLNKAIIQSWLSSPLTQVRNIAGNAFVALERPLATAIGAGTNTAQRRAAMSMFDSFGQSIQESFTVARESLKHDQPITGGSKFHDYNLNTQKEVEALVKTAQGPAEKTAAISLKWFHDLSNHPWVTWPGKGLQGGDDFFKTLVTRMDLRYQAALEADKLGSKTFKEGIYQELVSKKIGPRGEILDDELMKNAKEATFQNELQGKMKAIADSINDHPEIKTFIPFVKTPHNINVYAVEHIPFLARFTQEYQQVMKTGTDQQKAMMKGREAIGGLLITSAFTAAALGNMTGNGPADPELKKLWLRDHEPMSIKVGNKWVSYRSLVGAELIFSAVSDLVSIGEMLPEGEGDKLAAQLIYTIANTATNRSYFKGFVDLSEVLDTKNLSLKKAERIFGDRLNAAAPLAGARQQFENALKTGMYEYRNNYHAIAGKLTGGILGRKIKKIDILTGEQMITGYEGVLNSINPFRVSTKSASPLVKVLSDIEYELKDVVLRTSKGVSLTPEEQQFIRKAMYADGAFPRALERYLTSPGFKAKYDRWERERGSSEHVERDQSTWYREVSRIVSQYRREAIRALEQDDSEIGRYFNARKADANTSSFKNSGSHARVTESLEALANMSN